MTHTLRVRPRSRAQLAYLAAQERYESLAESGCLDARHKLRLAEESLLDWGKSQSYQLTLAHRPDQAEAIAEGYDRARTRLATRDGLIETVMRLTI